MKDFFWGFYLVWIYFLGYKLIFQIILNLKYDLSYRGVMKRAACGQPSKNKKNVFFYSEEFFFSKILVFEVLLA